MNIIGIKIISKYKNVLPGQEKTFLMQEISKLQDEPYTLQERYTLYKNDQSMMKLYKLKDGDFGLKTEGQEMLRFRDAKSGKITYCMMYELLIHLSDETIERFSKDLQILLSILFIKKS